MPTGKRPAEAPAPVEAARKKPASASKVLSPHCGCPVSGGDDSAAAVDVPRPAVLSLPPVVPHGELRTLVLGTNTTTFESQAQEYFARTDHAFWWRLSSVSCGHTPAVARSRS